MTQELKTALDSLADMGGKARLTVHDSIRNAALEEAAGIADNLHRTNMERYNLAVMDDAKMIYDMAQATSSTIAFSIRSLKKETGE